MAEIMMKFKLVRNNECFEAKLDDRLSFVDNLKMLEVLSKKDIKNCYVYDPNKKIFLDVNIPLNNFEISSFVIFNLF